MTPAGTFRPPHRLALAAALLVTLAAPARAQLALPDDFVEDIVYHGLDLPTAIAILPDRRLFVVEKVTARVRLIVNGSLAAVDPVVTVPEVDASNLELGLLGIAVDPGWPGRPYIYVHYNHSGSPNIRLSRYTVAGDTAFIGDGSLTIDPATRYDILTDIVDNTAYHNGGGLRFGPDGMLYCSIGDDNSPCLAQNLTSLSGKILRLDVSALPEGGGGPPAKSLITPLDNPFVMHMHPNARLVAHRGMRNPFRFAIDRETGEMLVGDVGLETLEELDLLPAPGANLQWPIYEGTIPGPVTCGGVDSSSWVAPIHTYDHGQGSAVIAGVIYRTAPGAANPFPPEYHGDIFFCDSYSPWVRRLKRTGDSWALAPPVPGQPNPTDWGTGSAYVTDWLIGPDGALYYCRLLSMFTQGPGEIRRIQYTAYASAPPPARPALEFHAPYPSPAHGAVTLDYALPAEGPVALTVYDAAGRRVRELVGPRRESAGPHRVSWDGRDAAGRRVAPGVYRARLVAGETVLERRVAFLR